MLATAIIRPRWLPEAAAAGPAAVVVIVTGALPWHQARTEAGRLLPVLVFLGAILVVGHVCQLEGLFAAAGWPGLAGARRSGCWAACSASPR